MKKQSAGGAQPKRSVNEGDLASIDWEQLYKRLLLAAYRTSGLVTEAGGSEAVIARVVSPRDLTQKVIEDFLQGKLRWQPEKGSLLRFLERVLRNDYLDLVTSKEARTTVRAELLKKSDEDKPDDSKKEVDFFDYYQVKKSKTLREHQMLIDEPESAEELMLGKEKLEGLKQLVSDDAELEEVVAAIIERDLLKPADIARYLGTTRQDIYNRFKRLRRCLGSLLPEKKRDAKLSFKN